jgi:hypothetical protein
MAAGPRGTVSAIIGTLAFIGNHNSVNGDTTFGLSIAASVAAPMPPDLGPV